MGGEVGANDAEGFTVFMAEAEPKVRRALVSGFGPDVGREATLDAFEYGWEHWGRVKQKANPTGYVYRVGVHCGARIRRNQTGSLAGVLPASGPEPWVEPKLDGALAGLSKSQRTAAVLIHGYGWTYQEVADLTGVRRSTVQRHVSRAMTKLRTALEVHDAVA